MAREGGAEEGGVRGRGAQKGLLDEFKARFGASKDAVAVKALEARLAGSASGDSPAAEPSVAPVPPPAQPAASGNGG